jgi:anti-anti-sigma factor
LLDYEVTERTGQEASILLRGELSDDVPSDHLKKELEHHFIDDGIQALRVDLSEVNSVDLEGIGVLLALWREARDHHKRLVIDGASGQVRDKLAVTGLMALIEGFDAG